MFERESFFQNIFQRLVSFGNVGDILKIIRVFAIVVRNLSAVSPNGNRRAGGVGVGAKLIFPILEFWLFNLNNNVFNGRTIFIKNNNVGGFYFSAKIDSVFKLDSLLWVAVFFQ